MELKVFESNDGALVAVLPELSDKQALALHFVGQACVPENALSADMLVKLDAQGLAVARRGDLRTLIRAMDTWVAPSG